MSKNLCLISLGCNKNLIDSEVMLGKLREYKLVDEPQNADVIIVNTCGFIASAKQESVEKILEVAMLKKKSAFLVVSGCLSERYSKELQEEIKEIDIITGVGDYNKIDLMIKELQDFKITHSHPKIITNNKTFLINDEVRLITGSNIHSYIKISEGCNQSCSFCAIPSFKGKLQSRSIESCVKEIDTLVNKGFRDFSFIAQDSSSYMRDLGKKDALIDLIDAVEKIDGIRSARILYLYPSSTSERLIDRIAESSVFQNYFDMPLQHISDSMFSIMRRGANKKQHIELLNHIRNIKDSFIRTTFLLGHPGEKQSDFDELCKFVNEFKFDRINLFAFSKEEHTRAYNMSDGVDSKITKNRINILNKIIIKQQIESFKSLVGKNIIAIIDGLSKESDLLFSARDIRWDRDIDGEILINDNLSNEPLSSGYYEVSIDDFKGDSLIGRVLRKLN
ncbi:30S ribosomal protein S12 methylthiotransferase RimO [Helicobacter sp. MIT 14-3879]|uniref:30S ribosomal protein S12 methylthiotransferase RimO n=1 Tax=Helicobacter sp. MIT 14-3879 TaxID=2040649 RepID=UPI000E1F4D73|nr:30S ribosomal protein S12 methylthiotransferase RimO [Helicobacter sp. MIT 14-3879]RDU65573.1 30S ribosomal protein S12 methylthiotransferase RimO [Helicobacter sp. MIT 14-3879]